MTTTMNWEKRFLYKLFNWLRDIRLNFIYSIYEFPEVFVLIAIISEKLLIEVALGGKNIWSSHNDLRIDLVLIL